MSRKTVSAVELRHLRLIAAVAEHGSLTAAAGSLNLTQPALSHQLRELETRLRSPLFVRTVRRMVPTAAGEELAVIARAVLPQVDAFERRVRDGELAAPSGEIRLATQCYTAYHWLPAVLRAFRDRWPSVTLRIGAEHTSATIRALREGALDLAIVYERSDDKRVMFHPLFDDEMVLVAAREHPLGRREHVALTELADHHLFTYTSDTRRSLVLNGILEPAGVEPRELTRVQLTEAIIELVAAGLGVAILAKWAVLPAVRSRGLNMARLGRRGFRRSWYAATRSAEAIPAFQFELIDLLRRHLGGGPESMRAMHGSHSGMRM